MTRRGRPPLAIQPVVFSVKLLLYPGSDDDLINYLRSAKPGLRSTMIKIAMRNGRLVTPQACPTDEDEPSFDELMV